MSDNFCLTLSSQRKEWQMTQEEVAAASEFLPLSLQTVMKSVSPENVLISPSWPDRPRTLVIAFPTQLGDTKIVWNKDSDVEVKNAKRTFEDLRKEGFKAYAADKDGSQGKEIKEWDPTVERMVMVPRIQQG